MKFVDLGVEFECIKVPMALQFYLHKKLPQCGKKSFLPNKSSIFIFSIFDFGAVIFFASIKGHIAQFFCDEKKLPQ
jgi:hypothetical protein